MLQESGSSTTEVLTGIHEKLNFNIEQQKEDLFLGTRITAMDVCAFWKAAATHL